MAEPKERLKNFKVLSIAESGTFYSKKHGKELKQYATVLQGVDDPTKILNGLSNDPLPEGFAAESVVEDVWVYVDEYQGKVTTKFFFPQKTGEGGGGKSGGGGYKISPEELSLRKFDLVTKVVGVGYSYARDILNGTPQEVTAKDLATLGNEIAEAMWDEAIKIKNQ